jgi:hypothetical protein
MYKIEKKIGVRKRVYLRESNMEALNLRLTQLKARQADILKERKNLEKEELDLDIERKRLEEERIRLSQKLSPHHEGHLKRELTILGELFEFPNVIKGELRIIPSPPTQDERDLYKILMKTGIVYEWGMNGLSVYASIWTVCPEVEAIIRSLFIQEVIVEDSPDRDLRWEINWDKRTSIKLTTHEALS